MKSLLLQHPFKNTQNPNLFAGEVDYFYVCYLRKKIIISNWGTWKMGNTSENVRELKNKMGNTEMGNTSDMDNNCPVLLSSGKTC